MTPRSGTLTSTSVTTLANVPVSATEPLNDALTWETDRGTEMMTDAEVIASTPSEKDRGGESQDMRAKRKSHETAPGRPP